MDKYRWFQLLARLTVRAGRPYPQQLAQGPQKLVQRSLHRPLVSSHNEDHYHTERQDPLSGKIGHSHPKPLHQFRGVQFTLDVMNNAFVFFGMISYTYLISAYLTTLFLNLMPLPDTSRAHPEHPVSPYWLGDTVVKRPNQGWATDITYRRIERGFA